MLKQANKPTYTTHSAGQKQPVLWIHDILVWIRIRGSCLSLMDPDADPDPSIIIDLQDANKKLI